LVARNGEREKDGLAPPSRDAVPGGADALDRQFHQFALPWPHCARILAGSCGGGEVIAVALLMTRSMPKMRPGSIIFGEGGEDCDVSMGLLERGNLAGRLDRVLGI
jgi:hypothetical protein